jgi:hypothetical protein
MKNPVRRESDGVFVLVAFDVHSIYGLSTTFTGFFLPFMPSASFMALDSRRF